MAIIFRTKRRVTTECTHESQIRIEIAGMSREVCESCGRVSVGFVADHFGPEWAQVETDISETSPD